MARSFATGNRIQSACSVTGTTFNFPANRSHTSFYLLRRTGSAATFNTIFTCDSTNSDGWQLGHNGSSTLYFSARGNGTVTSALSLTLNTTYAVAVRWDNGVGATFWIHPEGGSVSGGTLVSSALTINTAITPSSTKLTIGNDTSTSGNNLWFPGTIQFAGIVEGAITDSAVTTALAALISGDMTALSSLDDRFAMHLSPGGVATSPEDDTSPNNQDSNLISGTTAVADLIAASGGGASVAPSDVAIALSVEAPSVTYTGPASVTPSDVAFALSVEAPAASASSPASVSDAVLALVAESPAITYTPPSGGALPSDAPIALAVEAPSLGYTPPNFTTAPDDAAMALAVEAPAVTYRPKYTVAVADIAFALAVEDPAATFTEGSGTPRTPKTFTAPARRNTFTVPAS